MIEYTNKITALYSRLSVGDEDRDGDESVNQKAFLERYARQHVNMPKAKQSTLNATLPTVLMSMMLWKISQRFYEK